MPETINRSRSSPRPDGRPVMSQQWGKLLFLHWPLPTEALAALLPRGVELDHHQGQAWIGVIPFTLWGVRASFLPPFPGLSAFHELNVRTYVRVGGVPGAWFFSLDASNAIAVHTARLTYRLPYYCARMDLEQQDQTIRYRSERTHRNAPPARFEATWNIREPLPESRPGGLEHFLTERYCLFTEHRGKLYRARIHHPTWPLRRAKVLTLESTMVEALGLPAPEGEPLAQYADHLAVEVWPLEAKEAAERRAIAQDAQPVTDGVRSCTTAFSQ